VSSADGNIRLSPTSYIVLGGLSLLGGEATPYEIKRLVSGTIGIGWSFPHSQLYAEPDRLAASGYVSVRREQAGRRRKIYTLTGKGRTALSQWRAEPVRESFEHRDLAIIKLFFGADPAAVAETQIEISRAALHAVEEAKEEWASVAPAGPMLAGDYAIQIRRAVLAFWSELARAPQPSATRARGS
jgi:PadR family transcriptional regulator, regulatory protein AphA